MNKRSKLWGLLGAGILTLGIAGVTLAQDLKEAHTGITVGWDENGDPFTDGFDGGPNAEACADLDLQPGDIVFHFVQSGQDTAAGPDDTNTLDVQFTGADDQTGVLDDTVQAGGKNVDWFVWVSSNGGDVTLDDAQSSVSGGELRVSHICVGDEPSDESAPPSEEPSTPPSFEASNEGETDAPSDAPSFDASQEGDTDAPSEPQTDALGTNGTASPADGAWLLVVALGVLLASIVVLTPARAKSRR